MKKIGLTAAALLLLLVAIGGHQNNANLLPTDLVGFWTTDEPRYQGRFLELYRVYVIVGAGPQEAPRIETVDSVETQQESDHILYTISSTDLSGVRDKMTLLYTPKNGGEIRFRHLENLVWKRHKENSGPQPAPESKPLEPAIHPAVASKPK